MTRSINVNSHILKVVDKCILSKIYRHVIAKALLERIKDSKDIFLINLLC